MDSKILIAEDEAKIRQLVASYLVREGFKVVEAADGQQAVEKFEDNDDVVLVMLDVMMPRKDGYDACRENRSKSDVPILMLTARDSERDEVTGFHMGADEYIAKPFSPTILAVSYTHLDVYKRQPLLGPQLMKAVTDLMSGKELPLRIITDERVFTAQTPREELRGRKY